MLISLDIQDDQKAKVFLEFLKSLDFVTLRSEPNEDEVEIMLAERLEEYEKNPELAEPLIDVLQALKKKYDF